MKKITYIWIAFLVVLILLGGVWVLNSNEKIFNNVQNEHESDYNYEISEFRYELTQDSGFLIYEYSDHQYDEKGQLISRKVKGDSNYVEYYTYDENGKVIERKDDFIISSYGVDITKYEYDEAGKLIKTTLIDGTDATEIIETFEYDENGLQVKSVEKGKNIVNEDYTAVSIYKYDEKNRLISDDRDNEGYRMLIEYEYDAADNVVLEYQTSYDGGKLKNKYRIDYEYDIFGNCVKGNCELIESDKGKESTVTYNYTYEKKEIGKISTENNSEILSKDEWKYVNENNTIVTPDSCLSLLKEEKHEGNSWFYKADNNENLKKNYLRYLTILESVCGFELEYSEKVVTIKEKDIPVGSLELIIDNEGYKLKISV